MWAAPRTYVVAAQLRACRFGSSHRTVARDDGKTLPTVVPSRLNVVKGLERTNQIGSFGRSGHLIGL